MSLSTPPSLAELLDDTRFDATSPFITEAVAASFARFADDREPDVEKLGDAWTRALAEKKPRSYSFAPPRGFQHGFTYAHEGYQIHNGYLSERSDAALSQLQQLGIDAVAVVPYTFMSAPKGRGKNNYQVFVVIHLLQGERSEPAGSGSPGGTASNGAICSSLRACPWRRRSLCVRVTNYDS